MNFCFGWNFTLRRKRRFNKWTLGTCGRVCLQFVFSSCVYRRNVAPVFPPTLRSRQVCGGVAKELPLDSTQLSMFRLQQTLNRHSALYIPYSTPRA